MVRCSSLSTAERGLRTVVIAEVMQLSLKADHIDETSGWSELAAHLLRLALEQEAISKKEVEKAIRNRLFELALISYDEHTGGKGLEALSSVHALAYGLKHGMFCAEQQRRVRFQNVQVAATFMHQELVEIEDVIFNQLQHWQEYRVEPKQTEAIPLMVPAEYMSP